MRAWTLFFPGNYPSEAELIASTEAGLDTLEMTNIFWLYVGIFIAFFCLSLTYQCKYQDEEQVN